MTLSGIPASLIDSPAAIVPSEHAFRLAELACRALGTEHLGLEVCRTRSLDDYGPYGELLRSSLTVYQYLRSGLALYRMLNTGVYLWLSRHGSGWRFNIKTVGGPPLAAYQSDLETVAITTKTLREANPTWSPEEISLAYRSREDLPDIELFAGSRILRGTGTTYFTIPQAMLEQRFPHPTPQDSRRADTPDWRLLPEDLGGLVRVQIEALLPTRAFGIDLIAESLIMSRRTLQRSLAEQGLTYSQLLSQSRIQQAARWLETSDMPIAEIASSLGYTDASNFTRAFRTQVGVAPQTFRERATK